MSKLTAERLRELLNYNQDTGVFTWAVRRNHNAIAGGAAGSTHKATGYRKIAITVDGKTKVMSAHRLAWLYMTGEWPAEYIDHINGDRTDNRWSNLRAVSPRVNSQNRRKTLARSGLMGAFWWTTRQQWVSRIRVNGGILQLGTFLTAQEAHEAYLTAKRRLHEGCTI